PSLTSNRVRLRQRRAAPTLRRDYANPLREGPNVTIRTFLPGDEVAQVGIYNETAAELPKFKPATVDEIRRRAGSHDFDPGTRFFAVEGGSPVGYASFHANGRVSFPWCRKG